MPLHLAIYLCKAGRIWLKVSQKTLDKGELINYLYSVTVSVMLRN